MSNGTSSPCPCTQPQDPQVVRNPPGLSQISYRVDDFTGFRRALLRHLPGEQAIGIWRPAAGDLGLQVLEWWAYLADVLTFYNERAANENYLRTATRQSSAANLVALLGYEPAPGIAATGSVAAMRTAAHPDEPLVIPAGLRLSSVATPGVPAQTFEASAAASFTGPSSVAVTLPASPDMLCLNSQGNPESVLLAGRVSGVKAGEQLLLAGSDFAGATDDWSLVTVQDLQPETDPQTGAHNTRITFSAGGWGPGVSPAAAPDTTAGYRLIRPAAAAALWNQTTTDSPFISGPPLQVRLSAAVRAISPGDWVLFESGAGSPVALAVVARVSEEFLGVPYPGSPKPVPPEIAVAHTVLTLTLADADSAALPGVTDTTAVTVRYGFRDLGTIIGAPATALTSLPASVGVPTSYTPPGSPTAFLQDTTGAGVLITVGAAGSGSATLTGVDAAAAGPLATPLAVPLRLLLDVVPVSRGTTVTGEVLGSGNAALINQSFTLSKSPLTYLASGAGWAAALTVYVDGVAWRQVQSFYGQAPDARVFVVSRSPDQAVTTVTFGDGVNGARLTSGTGNVVATYRYGSGAPSPPAGRLTTISRPQPNLASIQNPVAVSGGADPQAIEDVRTDAPASVFAFGRAISAVDYEVIAAQAPGVSRAAAYWIFDQTEQRTLVTIYVGDDPGAVAAARAALAGSEDPNRPVSVTQADPIELSLSCTLVVAADRQADAVITAATAAVSNSAGGLFSPARMAIGQRLYRSAIDAALMVPGVVAVHGLTVTRTVVLPRFRPRPPVRRDLIIRISVALDEYFDAGQGRYFDLPPGNVSIGG